MKVMTKASLTVSLISVMLILGGCGGDEAVQETPPEPTRSIQPPEPPPPEPEPQVQAPEPEPEPEVNPLEQGLLSQRIVYFDFDSSVITDEALPIVKAHAEYLASNRDISFTLEGHCDERGTREYNIALGERRADAVRRMLIANGVSDNQIKVVSYGEERPQQLGHNETAWAANRRAVFAY